MNSDSSYAIFGVSILNNYKNLLKIYCEISDAKDRISKLNNLFFYSSKNKFVADISYDLNFNEVNGLDIILKEDNIYLGIYVEDIDKNVPLTVLEKSISDRVFKLFEKHINNSFFYYGDFNCE
jgi:hypothetical protein